VLCTSHSKRCRYADPKPFFQAYQHVLTFPHPILICRVIHTGLCWSCCSKVAADFLDN
jgi:hypothetical protein